MGKNKIYLPKQKQNDYVQLRKEESLLQREYTCLKTQIINKQGKYILYVYGYYNQLETCYKYRIVYDGRNAPEVTILTPDLIPNPPHTYKDGSLCLYYPKEQPWEYNKSHLYSHIVPWTHEWIYFYERYLAFGEWEHPEVKHGKRKDKYN